MNKKKHGKWTFWYNNGTRENGKFIKGKREGIWTEKYYNGQKRARRKYTKGVIFGTETFWYMNGEEEEIIYRNRNESIKNGWHLNGQKYYELHFKDDKLNGKYIFWFSDGLKSAEGQTILGKEEGLCITWDRKGVKTQEVEYEKGKIIRILIGKIETITNQYKCFF